MTVSYDEYTQRLLCPFGRACSHPDDECIFVTNEERDVNNCPHKKEAEEQLSFQT